MKTSLKFKIFLILISLVLLNISLYFLMNNLFLDKYYMYKKNAVLLESLKEIKNIYANQSSDMSLELEKLETKKGLRIVILDKDLQQKYGMQLRPNQLETKQTNPKQLRPDELVLNELPPKDEQPNFLKHNKNDKIQIQNFINKKSKKISNGGIIVEAIKDERLNLKTLTLLTKIHTGEYIFISTPMSAIQDNIQVVNQFSIITGIITIILGGIVVLIITGKFTTPIMHLREITKKMENLDFSEKYNSTSNDEIGQLGESINSMSDKLEIAVLELKSTNEKLKEEIDKERKIDEMRKEFINNVSHELKTPIALIQGYAEGLKLNVNKDEENKNLYCDIIMDESDKMNKLVKQLLNLAHMESKGVSIEKTGFEILKIIDEVLKKNQIIFKEKEIDVKVESEENLKVNADYDKIEQILTNYITNAINHVNENKLIKVKIADVNDKVRVSVYNSGKHISEEDLDKVWISFYKVDKARTRAYGGTGLGLAVVKAIQEAHKNNYGVNNVEDGVEFWFELDKV